VNSSNPFHCLLAAFCLAVLPVVLPAGVEPEDARPIAANMLRDPGTRRAEPDVAAASDEAQQALSRMQLPPGLEARLWAAEPMLANPVAIAFDERGRLFVAETHRFRSSVLDIRDYRWMVEEELACRTLEDRAALMRRRFGAAGMKELSIEQDLVRLLTDTDHDGVADRSSVYADGFNGPLEGIAAGLVARRGSVWLTNIPSLWRLEGADRAERRIELSRGYGVRFNFTGHDLHGPVFGPDGKLYYSIGDRGAHVPTPDGGVVAVPDTGAVFRCNPDGTGLEVFATGLRNPQGLAFNDRGDLFTGDNDADAGDEERLIHVVQGGDFGWRIGYQFAPLGRAGPWNSEQLWHPRHEGQPAYLLPAICNIEDGPSGIAFYPGTGLNSSYRDTLFITHFKGAIAKSGIYTYTLQPDGASYRVADCQPFLTSALPTDAKFGPDGRLYVTDWGEGWRKSSRGRIYAIGDPRHAGDPVVRETEQLIGGDWTARTTGELARLLAHADWRVRLEAQFTLAERGLAAPDAQPELGILAKLAGEAGAPALARRHAIWGLGQLASRHAAALIPLRALSGDPDPEVRAQALHVLGDHPSITDAGCFGAALADDSDRVKYFAAQGLAKIGPAAGQTGAVVAALRANDDRDATLRHGLVMALAGGRDRPALLAAAKDISAAVARGVLLALRRLGDPAVAGFLADTDPLLVREAALAINDAPIDPALPELARLLANPGTDEPVILRAINAHFRLGRPEDATALAEYAARPDAPAPMRAEALRQLALWPQPPPRDRIVGVYRPLAVPTRDGALATAALGPFIRELLAPPTPAAVQTAALAAMQQLKTTGAADALFAATENTRISGEVRATALAALDRLGDPRLAGAVREAGASADPTLRLAALPIATRLSPETAATVLAGLVAHGTDGERRAAFTTLGKLRAPFADEILAAQLRQLASGGVPPAAQLELLEAAARRTDPAVKALLAERTASLAADADPLAAFRPALAGGNPQSGARIFHNQPDLACIRCHRAGAEGGDAGPNLAGVGARHDRKYLLESIVRPNAAIAPGFDTVVLTLRSGEVAAGTVAAENGATITLRQASGDPAEIRKTDITSRASAPSAMPEIYGTILSQAELRDLVAFLAGLTDGETGPADAVPRALRGRRNAR